MEKAKHNGLYVSVPFDVIGEIADTLKDYAEDLQARARRARNVEKDDYRADFFGKEAVEVKHLADILVDSRVTATIRSVCCQPDPRTRNW